MARSLVGACEAVPASVPQLRGAAVELARDGGADTLALDAIRLAISEAVSNVVLHAYSERGGRIYFSAAVSGDELWVVIGDDGRGLHVRSEHSGLGWGLRLIENCTDCFELFERPTGGTELRMSFPLRSDKAGGALYGAQPLDHKFA